MKTGKQTSWYSNGNLLISGEYFVLAGAKALAVPLKYGQSMKINCFENDQNAIHWESNEMGKSWFKAELNCEDLNITGFSDREIALKLQKVLKAIKQIKPELFSKNMTYDILCDIRFNLNWGWGSSSTLIANLANWAGIDPFKLNKLVSAGSGYDIAASLSPTPVFYQITDGHHLIDPVVFNPIFREFISFVYMGKKQNTESSIVKNIESVKKNMNMVPLINSLTEKFAGEENMEEFIRSISEHEKIISATLNMTRIKEKYFRDFEGEIKSLGAWGGDFAMVVSPINQIRIKQYFREKGLETIFRFDEIVKN